VFALVSATTISGTGNQPFLRREGRERFRDIDQEGSGALFEKVSVEVLNDASKLQLLKSLNRVARGMHPEDVFLFYAASHGVAQDTFTTFSLPF